MAAMPPLVRMNSILSVVLLIATPGAVLAQTARSGGAAASAEMMQQLQQLASERTALQAENARLKREVEELRKDRDGLKSGQQGAAARIQAAQAALSRTNVEHEATENELTQLRARMQELIGKFRETAQTLKEVEAEHATGKQSLEARDRELKACVDRNTQLYKLNDEVLTHFDRQGTFSCMARAESFTRIKRTQLENLIDGYRNRADDQKIPADPNKVTATDTR